MILTSPKVGVTQLERRTGWELKPEGACKGDVCVPLGDGVVDDDLVDVAAFAERLGMPIVHDEENRLWALGPESGGKALTSARLPDIELPDIDGRPFAVSSLRGRKVLLVAWASW